MHGQTALWTKSLDQQFQKWDCDTVSFFLFEKDVVDNYTWDEIVKNYQILQRYDFSKEDLIRLDCKIPYPPTEKMSGMHMYPPYNYTTNSSE